MLDDSERKQLLTILIHHPFLENDRKRRALLINSGLEHLLSEIETAGSSREFVHLLYAALTRTLLSQPSQDLWFISLLTYLLDFSGPHDFRQEDQEFLTRLRQTLRQKRAAGETLSVVGGKIDPSSALQQEVPARYEKDSR